MLRATAEEAMTQTGFVFDENTGMYYDHSTGFYYDSVCQHFFFYTQLGRLSVFTHICNSLLYFPQVSQLYYDANTGIYYYYDAESGRYQFHSKIEVPAAQASAETCQENNAADKKGRKVKKWIKKAQQDDRVCNCQIFCCHAWACKFLYLVVVVDS